MKNCLVLIFLVITIHAFCQNQNSAYIVYDVAQQMPEYPGGEDSMWRFIMANMKYPDSAAAHDIQGRVIMGFIVNEDGHLSDITVKKGPSWDIDSEAVRVVKLMPPFKPGTQDGKPVKVRYLLPLTFKLLPAKQDSLRSNYKFLSGKWQPAKKDSLHIGDSVKVPHVVEVMPKFPGGDSAMMRLIQRNIRYPDMSRENDIKGKVVIGFVVNEDGSISDLKVIQSVFPEIDAEAIRVVKLLPKFQPGTQQGKPVRVQYRLPIGFRLEDGTAKAPKIIPYTTPTSWDDLPVKVDVMPQLSGGVNAMTAFLENNVKYPKDAFQLNIYGVVVVGFIVNEDGHLSDFAFVQRDYQSLNKEAMRVAKLLPNFQPGMKNGKSVKVLYKLPIRFSMNPNATEKKM